MPIGGEKGPLTQKRPGGKQLGEKPAKIASGEVFSAVEKKQDIDQKELLARLRKELPDESVMLPLVAERIKSAIEKSGLSFRAFADNGHIERTTLQRIINGRSAPSLVNLIYIVESLGLSLDEVLLGHNRLSRIPDYRGEVEASPIALSEETFAKITQAGRCSRKAVFYVMVDDDVMSPTIQPGSIVFAARSKKLPAGQIAGIYVIIIGDAVLVRRLLLASAGQVDVLPDNDNYKIQRFPVSEVSILGRLIWRTFTMG